MTKVLLFATLLLSAMGWAQTPDSSRNNVLTNTTAPTLAPVTPSASALGLPNVSKPDLSTSALSGMLPDLGLKLKLPKRKKNATSAKRETSKTEYEGLPMQRMTTKFGSGDRTTEEVFYVLKEPRNPLPYVRETFWYHRDEGRVSSSVIKDKNVALLLHGPYKRFQNGNLVEEGYYYVGAKDGRWEKYDGTFMLLDKARWHHGFPADARVTYYDSAHTKLKEVVPFVDRHQTGQYVAFYENGLLAEEGRYDHGRKVGRWIEYYPTEQVGRRRKRVTQHARDRWDADAEPYVLNEWDDRGKVIYERPKSTVVTDEETGN